MFVLGKFFQSSLMFVGKAGAYQIGCSLRVLHSRIGYGLTANIRLDGKGLPGTHTLAYYKKS